MTKDKLGEFDMASLKADKKMNANDNVPLAMAA